MADQSTELAQPQRTAAVLSRQEHNRALAAAFGTPAAVQESQQPPKRYGHQASAFRFDAHGLHRHSCIHTR